MTATNGTRTLQVRNAQITTAAVQVQSLTISNRQVTLAVFRQLLNEDLLDADTGAMLGTPWGRVNYYFGDCKEGSHLHVVWQKGDELRRACVGRIRPYDDREEERWRLDKLRLGIIQTIAAVLLLDWLDKKRPAPLITEDQDEVFFQIPGGNRWRLRKENPITDLFRLLRAKFDETPRTLLAGYGREETPADVEKRLAEREECLRADASRRINNWLHEALGADADIGREPILDRLRELEREYCDCKAEIQKADKLHAENYELILATPHLFIAV
jgi:hypothetical protein